MQTTSQSLQHTARYIQQKHKYNHTFTASTHGSSQTSLDWTQTKRLVHSSLLILQIAEYNTTQSSYQQHSAKHAHTFQNIWCFIVFCVWVFFLFSQRVCLLVVNLWSYCLLTGSIQMSTLFEISDFRFNSWKSRMVFFLVRVSGS